MLLRASPNTQKSKQRGPRRCGGSPSSSLRRLSSDTSRRAESLRPSYLAQHGQCSAAIDVNKQRLRLDLRRPPGRLDRPLAICEVAFVLAHPGTSSFGARHSRWWLKGEGAVGEGSSKSKLPTLANRKGHRVRTNHKPRTARPARHTVRGTRDLHGRGTPLLSRLRAGSPLPSSNPDRWVEGRPVLLSAALLSAVTCGQIMERNKIHGRATPFQSHRGHRLS